MGYLQVYWKKYGIRLMLGIFFLSLEAFADLLQPALMSQIVDQGIARSNWGRIEYFGLLMFVITGAGAICACMRNLLSGIVSQRFAQDLRQDLYIKIQRLPQKGIDRFGSASLITRLTNDVTRVQNFVNGLMRIMVKAPLVGIGSLIMAVRLNLPLSVVLIAMAPVIAFLIMLNMKISYPLFRRVQHTLDRVNRSMQDFLAGIRIIKVFGRSDYEQKKFQENNEKLGGLSATASKIGSTFTPLINLVVNLGIMAILWFGAVGVNNGSMRVGSIIAFTNYMMQLLFAIVTVNNAFNLFVRARASAERIGDVMNHETDNRFRAAAGRAVATDKKGTIEFRHVTFSFSEQKQPVLSDVNFSVDSGETLGIIGPIASGKSTLVQLMLRFYDPEQGCILFNGNDLKLYNEHELRKKIAVVPQQTILFSGSVIDNIRWGNETASDEEVRAAAHMAAADTFIGNLPNGYYSYIGQGGVNLSGGQKQRIAIARALIRKPELLILDDATSAVDTRTEKIMRTRLQASLAHLTCVIISQKVASIKEADQIIVLNHGRIEAAGKHLDLRTRSAFYRDVCNRQMVEE